MASRIVVTEATGREHGRDAAYALLALYGSAGIPTRFAITGIVRHNCWLLGHTGSIFVVVSCVEGLPRPPKARGSGREVARTNCPTRSREPKP
jgi:hypothetical protein